MVKQEPSPSLAASSKLSSMPRRFFFWLFFLLFIGGGFFSGMVASPQMFGWVESTVATVAAVAPNPLNLLPSSGLDWSRHERVNILLLGIDRRPDEGKDPFVRTDVMIVMTIDPPTKSAGMLSIPRDLFVPIPLDGAVIQERINTANVYGEYYKYPGGGIALARETVKYNFGIPIHYYLIIDFEGFQRMVDTMGGITVDVEKAIVDYAYPTPDYGTMVLQIPAGTQHFNGEQALQYVRSRHNDSDFGRIRRQQQVMMAMRNKTMQLDVVPKIPQLWSEFQNTVQTDLTLPEILALANVARNIDSKNIVSKSLEAPYVSEMRTRDGAEVLVLNRAVTKQLIDDIFFDPRAQQQTAHIEILNGTGTPGLAANWAKQLEDKGFRQVTTGDASDGPHDRTQIYSLSGVKYSADVIASLLNFPTDRIQTVTRMTGGAIDIRIVLGKDTLTQNLTGTSRQP